MSLTDEFDCNIHPWISQSRDFGVDRVYRKVATQQKQNASVCMAVSSELRLLNKQTKE